MKKIVITGVSVALAAMPVLGVFADGTGTVTKTTTDTLTLTVPKGCNIQTSPARSDTTAAFGSVAPGQTATDDTDPIVITCNAGWTLTPTIQAALASSANTIASGTTLDGSASNWALKLTVTGDLTNNFNDYNTVNGTNKVSNTAAASALSITPSYKVSVGPGQANGSYTGTVLYTVAETN